MKCNGKKIFDYFMMDEKIIFSHKKSIYVRSRAFALSNKKPWFCFHLMTTDKDITLYVKCLLHFDLFTLLFLIQCSYLSYFCYHEANYQLIFCDLFISYKIT